MKNFMEQLNRIEIRGNVGSVKLQKVGDRLAARFTVATNYAYKDKDGAAVIETTWHNVSAWQGRGETNFQDIVKGSKIYVMGRLRNNKFTGSDGQEHSTCEINAQNVVLIDDVDTLQCEC